MSAYADIEIHGTPAGYKAGCKTDQMCDDSAPWSCKRAYERYRGDYQFHKRIDEGLSPAEIHELEAADADRIAQEEAAWQQREGLTGMKPKKKTKTTKKRAALATEPDRLAAYGPAVTAAKERIASAPEPPTITDLANEHAALAEIFSHGAVIPTPSKEHPMPENLPAGVQWKEPPPAALAASGPRSKNQRIIALAKTKPREWLCIGQAAASAATRWRKGDVTGTKPREFEAVVDNGVGLGTKGDLYIRYVGAPK